MKSFSVSARDRDCKQGLPRNAPPPSLGVGDRIGEGDSELVLDILPPELAESAFENMRKEVAWNVMHHQGGEVPRLVAVEGEVAADGSFPIYRHPADKSPALRPFSPTVSLIREHVQKVLDDPVNHVLIQHYRSGADYISEHSDKTIDVVRGSKVVNVSLGAQRVMTLRLKRDGVQNAGESGAPRPSQKIPLPHNSMFVLGLNTNMKWLHAINHDKRPIHLKSPEETFMNGERISLTFRHIGTFLSRDESCIYGQGATGKTCDAARPVVHGTEEAAKLLQAFGKENQQSDFDWEGAYGDGFDVLHFTPRDT
ncbi:hypothetical protein HYDPIDRAFT_176519 [Hydnomerulius pinastri MD-312]|uniref:Fe2OG dioxygenase domain-containing protein n=1 Tax=Hydnomerulius pinastri MD-312 TaxID=994086 RepID=A0A0C9V9M2_9AGAM|nr:hypothetical protein HYDPIDRAFT_176519 [Hydnomerulius pinastri MD-312]